MRVPLYDDLLLGPSAVDAINAITAAREVTSNLRMGRRVMISCESGYDRSAWIAAMVMINLEKAARDATDVILKIGRYAAPRLSRTAGWWRRYTRTACGYRNARR